MMQNGQLSVLVSVDHEPEAVVADFWHRGEHYVAEVRDGVPQAGAVFTVRAGRDVLIEAVWDTAHRFAVNTRLSRRGAVSLTLGETKLLLDAAVAAVRGAFGVIETPPE